MVSCHLRLIDNWLPLHTLQAKSRPTVTRCYMTTDRMLLMNQSTLTGYLVTPCRYEPEPHPTILRGRDSTMCLKHSSEIQVYIVSIAHRCCMSAAHPWGTDICRNLVTKEAMRVAVTGKSVVWSLAFPVCLSKYPWARHWTPSCSWCTQSLNVCVY